MERVRLSENFFLDEFECKCCGGVFSLDPMLVEKLQELRNRVGPITITSGTRCPKHNTEIYTNIGKQPTKLAIHTLGKAADITFPGIRDHMDDIRGLFNGIGWANGWVHVDVRDKRTEWNYT